MLASVLAYVSSFVVLASLIVPVVPRRTTNFTHLHVPPLTDFDPRPSTGHDCTTSHFQSITAFGVLSLVFVLSARALRHALPVLSDTTRIAVYYLTAITFYLVVWASRLSILFSIVRIDTTKTSVLHCNNILHNCTVVGGTIVLGLRVAVFQFITDVTSDAILLFAPWPLFRSLVDKSLGRKLAIIFSVCVITTIVSFVHAVLIFKDDDFGMPFSGIVECCISLIVANIPVIITTTIDIVGDPEPRETAEFSTIFWPGPNGAMQLQTFGQQHPHDVTLSCAESTPDMSSESLKSQKL
ncbi:hypothetical protein C8R45DRAFT_1091532 [Mycena sanguinolenta]|nr:hypothetical protein C8R45DRAFT_1091532 [Mycena sanguinolenta]